MRNVLSAWAEAERKNGESIRNASASWDSPQAVISRWAAATSFDKRTYEPIDEVDKISCRPDFAISVYKRAAIPAELHVYANTAHDFGVRTNERPHSKRTARRADWLREGGFLYDRTK